MNSEVDDVGGELFITQSKVLVFFISGKRTIKDGESVGLFLMGRT